MPESPPEHRCWKDAPWQAYSRWESVPQGAFYWRAMTSSTKVAVPLFYTYAYSCPYEWCCDEAHDHTFCAQFEDLERQDKTTLTMCGLVFTKPVFEVALAKHLNMSDVAIERHELRAAKPIEYTAEDYLLPAMDHLCGPQAILEVSVYDGDYMNGRRMDAIERVPGYVIESDWPAVYGHVVVPIWSVVEYDAIPKELDLQWDADADAASDILFSDDPLPRLAAIRNTDTSSFRMLDQIIQQQKADWATMLYEVGDPCSRSQLQSLGLPVWDYWQSATQAS